MAEEKEVKIQLRNEIPLEAVVEKVQNLGFAKHSEKAQVDSYFDFKDFALSENVQAIRIRKENSVEKCFEFKALFYIPGRKYNWFVEEVCCHFSIKEKEKLEEVFNLLGLKILPEEYPVSPSNLVQTLKENNIVKVFDVSKQRTSFKKEGIIIELDQVDGLGNFLEIESESIEPHKLLHEFSLGELGSEVRFGYVSAYREKFYGINPEIQKKKFLEKPDWNVLESEREFYRKICEQKS